MKKLLLLLAMLLAALSLASPAAMATTDAAVATEVNVVPGTALAQQLGCTYNAPTLHAGAGPYTVWSGSQGELVRVWNYVQVITSPNCGISARSATNWLCTKFLVRANCGADLTHWIREDGVGDWSITVYDCEPGNGCFGSSGDDGEFTTYSAWHAASSGDTFQNHLDVQEVVVVGRPSISNHHSTSGWTTV